MELSWIIPARLLPDPSPLGGGVAAVPNFSLSCVALLLGVQQLAPGTPGADAFLGKVGANQRVLLLALFSHGAIAFEEILAHFCFSGHIDVAVRAVAVAADPLQEVGAHRHLVFGHLVGKRTGPVRLLARATEKPGADGHFLRIMDVGAALPAITLAKAVVVHTVFLLLFLLLGLTNDGQTSLNSTAGDVSARS